MWLVVRLHAHMYVFVSRPACTGDGKVIKTSVHMQVKGNRVLVGGIFTEDKKFNSKQILGPSAQYLFKLGLLSAIQCG